METKKSKSTGIVYDDFFLRHDNPGHPETAERLRAIHARLKKSDLLPLLSVIPATEATVDTIYSAHSHKHVDAVKHHSDHSGQYVHVVNDTYFNQYTYQAALMGVGGLINLCDSVVAGVVKNGFNFSRPPGHHATRDRFMGFCMFSTAAIAALHLMSHVRRKKIAIVDFDVHHGNGTEDICKDHPDILFVSIHQAGIYPQTGSAVKVNSAAGGDNIINCPLPPHVENEYYFTLMDRVVIPALVKFNPDFIVVSAGYDAHRLDPLANIDLTSRGFGIISKKLVDCAGECCDGNIVFNLEGGYNLKALAHSAENSIRALMGQGIFDDDDDSPGVAPPNPDALIETLRRTHHLA